MQIISESHLVHFLHTKHLVVPVFYDSSFAWGKIFTGQDIHGIKIISNP